MVQNLESPGLYERVDSIEKRTNEAALCFRFFLKKFSTNSYNSLKLSLIIGH